MALHRRARAFVLIVAVPVAIFLAHAWSHLPFLVDDALITLRYARRLLDGYGLTWTEGPRVDGYSNLLWLLLSAGLGAVGIDLVIAVRLLGTLAMIVVPCALWWAYGRGDADADRVGPASVASMFFALAAPIAVWAIGGLEQPLLAAALAVAIVACNRLIDDERPSQSALGTASVALGVMCVTRPDGPVFTVAAVASVLLAARCAGRPWPWRTAVWLACGSVVLYGAQLGFRLAYYSEWVPNTALVKVGFSGRRLAEGASYVLRGLLSLAPWSLVGVAAMLAGLRSTRSRGRALLLLVTTAAWLGYVAVVGGDIFPAFRHLVPIVVVLAFAVAEGGCLATEWLARRGRRPGLVLPLSAGALLAAFAVLQVVHPQSRAAREERWEWDGQVAGLMLKQAFGARQPLIAVTAAGCLPYWSGLPALDMLGLNDHYLPRHKPADDGRFFLGHELGDGRYVLSRAPDLIAFHTGEAVDIFRTGQELAAMPEFHQRYTKVRMLGRDPRPFRFTLWVQRASAKIGMRETADRIDIPAFLLNANGDSYGELDAEGRLVVGVSPGKPAGIVLGDLQADDWEVSVDASPAGQLRVAMTPEDGATRLSLEAAGTGDVFVRQVTLTRRAGTH